MFCIQGTKIELTKGDSFYCQVEVYEHEGEAYEPQESDSIRFAVKKNYASTTPVIVKPVPTDTLIFHLDPSDTKDLAVGNYVYDVEITFADGDVDTFIKGIFTLTPEVM